MSKNRSDLLRLSSDENWKTGSTDGECIPYLDPPLEDDEDRGARDGRKEPLMTGFDILLTMHFRFWCMTASLFSRRRCPRSQQTLRLHHRPADRS